MTQITPAYMDSLFLDPALTSRTNLPDFRVLAQHWESGFFKSRHISVSAIVTKLIRDRIAGEYENFYYISANIFIYFKTTLWAIFETPFNSI